MRKQSGCGSCNEIYGKSQKAADVDKARKEYLISKWAKKEQQRGIRWVRKVFRKHFKIPYKMETTGEVTTITTSEMIFLLDRALTGFNSVDWCLDLAEWKCPKCGKWHTINHMSQLVEETSTHTGNKPEYIISDRWGGKSLVAHLGYTIKKYCKCDCKK